MYKIQPVLQQCVNGLGQRQEQSKDGSPGELVLCAQHPRRDGSSQLCPGARTLGRDGVEWRGMGQGVAT